MKLERTNKNHVLRSQSSKESFQCPFIGTSLGTAQENDAEQGSPGQTLAPGVQTRKWTQQAANSILPWKGWSQRGNRCHCQYYQAHSTRQGGVVSVRVVTQHSWAVHHERPTSNHCYQSGSFDRSLQEACWNLEGVHKKTKRGMGQPHMTILYYGPQEVWLNHQAP